MSSKKSYMDNENILNEGFFNSILKSIGMDKGSRIKRKINKLEAKKRRVVKKSGIEKDIDKINLHANKILNNLEKIAGVDLDRVNFSLEDFIDKYNAS